MALDPGIAPGWRRMAAGAVDGGLLMSGWGVVFGAAIARAKLRDRELDAEAALERLMKAVFGEGEVATRRSRRLDLLTRFARISLRNGRTPGQRLLGIRRVDARTGGPVPLRGAVVRELLGALMAAAVRALNRPRMERWRAEQAERQRAAVELREELGHDPKVLATAMRGRGRAPGCGCWSAFAPSFAIGSAEPLTALLSPRRQSLIERIAGVVVVRDRA